MSEIVPKKSHLCVFPPSSAESAGISTAHGQVAKFLDQVPCLCNGLELCILWYMVHNMPYKDATTVTVGVNILFIEELIVISPAPPHPLKKNLCLLLLVVSQIYAISLVSFTFICIFYM